MIQAYQGHFQENGQFISDTDNIVVKIPTNRRVIINILDEPVETEVKVKQSKEEITKRQEMVKLLKGCLAGCEVDLKQIRDERISKRGLL